MNLKEKPFYLKEEEIAWVEQTLQEMTLEEKIGQLFCPIGYATDREYLTHELLRWHIGGLFFRDGKSEEMRDTFAYAQSNSKIPLLIPSNLEAGGNGAAIDGTPYGKQMQVAASQDKQNAYRLGKVACSEGAALGINWAFAPVADIDLNYHNPITNVRTYGSDADTVLAYAKEYIKAAKDCGVAACAKHFPGDGVDERDQHLLTSVNSLSIEEWNQTFGKVYRGLIEAGTPTIMAGHIAMPAYQAYFDKEAKEEIIPATLSHALLTNLLRETLGFNGLIVTDATPMVGFTSAMDRRTAVPLAIESGCDMFLFNKSLEEDYQFMMEGYQNGILSQQRLLDANRRILALKASLGLPGKKKKNTLVPPQSELSMIGCSEHKAWSKELAQKAITLVKDANHQLPIDAKKTPRVLLEIMGDFPSNERVLAKMKVELEKQGFQVIPYEKEDFEKGVDTVATFREKYDMVLYIGNVENASNQTTNRLNWYTFWGQGNNVPWFAKEVPVIFVSVANPYHLLDVPMISTYINCYSNHDEVLEAVVEKLVGKSAFLGKSPVDVFCGRKDLAIGAKEVEQEREKPKLHTEICRPCNGLTDKGLKTGDSIVFDFGNHYVGKLSFHCNFKGSLPDAPAFLKIKFCEVERELDEDSSHYEGWISKSWIQEEWLHIDMIPSLVAMPRRYAFRYVKIEALDISTKYELVIDDLYVEAVTSADDSAIQELTANPQEMQLDKISIRTLRNCMQEVLEDGPKRDRRLWIGDLRLQALTNYETYRNYDIVKYCIKLFAQTADEQGRVRACLFIEPKIAGDDTYLFDYSLFFIPILLDYYRASKDTETVLELLDVAKRQIMISRDYFGENHLIYDSDEMGWCFLDWNLNLNKQAGAQAVYIYCEKALVELLVLLGEKEEANLFSEDANKKAQAAVTYLYDEELGFFVSGEDRQVSYASQVWAVLADIFEKEESKKLLQRLHCLQDNATIQLEPMVTPYLYHHYVEALLHVGMRTQAYQVMMSYWGSMAEDGADTFYELFNPKNPEESPYGSCIVNSYCHAWSCTPSYFMRKYGLLEHAPMRGFIFDLDGVLVSTDVYHNQAWKQIADKLQIPFDEKTNHRLRGVSRMESLDIILEQYDKPLTMQEKERLAEEKNAAYCKMLTQMSPADVADEVRETLQVLHQKGYLLAVGSSSKNAQYILEQTQLLSYFDAVIDGNQISQSKPHPEVFEKAAEALKLLPKQCIVVEDAVSGIDAAKAAGMTAIGIQGAAQYKKTDYAIGQIKELQEAPDCIR